MDLLLRPTQDGDIAAITAIYRQAVLFGTASYEIEPPNQAEMMIAALAAKGVPHAYVAFPGEQHGFRQAENIIRSLEAELWFYSRVFGFTPADDIEPVEGAVGLD